jgi:hypothetical protein
MLIKTIIVKQEDIKITLSSYINYNESTAKASTQYQYPLGRNESILFHINLIDGTPSFDIQNTILLMRRCTN